MRILEEEFSKAMKAEEAKLQVRILKVQQQEKQLTSQQLEFEKARVAFRQGQNDLASRVASLDKELARVKGDADLQVARMKDMTNFEVTKARQQMKDLQAANELLKKELKSTQSKLVELREEYEKDKLKHAKSNFGAVELSLKKKEDELDLMKHKWEEALKERDYEKSRLQAALSKAMQLHHQIETMKLESLEQKNRDADYLRAQYLAKERQAGASRSVAEAHEIRQQVKAHLQAMAGPSRPSVMDTTSTTSSNVAAAAAAAASPLSSMGQLSSSLPPPTHSTSHPMFNTFQTAPPHLSMSQSGVPVPPVPLPVSSSHSLGGSLGRTNSFPSSFGVEGTHAPPVSSLPHRANLIPEPYHFLLHEQELMSQVKNETQRHPYQQQQQHQQQPRHMKSGSNLNERERDRERDRDLDDKPLRQSRSRA